MRVTLTEQLAEIVRQKLDSGHYASVEDVFAEALKLLDQRDKKLAALREDIREGLASGPGRLFDEEVVKEIKKRGRERMAEPNNIE